MAEVKDKQLKFRVTPSFYQLVCERAKINGLSKIDYLIMLVTREASIDADKIY